MFTGPNGSVKSTLKARLRPDPLSHGVNVDEIELALRSPHGFNFSLFSLAPSEDELRFSEIEGNSYSAATIADFVRRSLL